MVVKSLLDIDLKELLRLIEERTGVKLPRDIIETYLDTEHDLLFIRFREPRGARSANHCRSRHPSRCSPRRILARSQHLR